MVQWCDFETVANKLLDGSVTGLSTCCLASWNGMFFWYFNLTISFSIFNFRATSWVCWMIAVTIGWYTMAHFLIHDRHTQPVHISHIFVDFCSIFCCGHIIKATSCIWNIQLCVTNQNTNLDLRGYDWIIYGKYVGILKYQLPIFASSCVQLWSHLGISVHLWCPLHLYSTVLCIRSHTLNNWVLYEVSL